MSNFPSNYDDDTTLPVVNDNIDEIGGDAINALRDAVFNIEQCLGIGLNGVMPTLADRLGVFINLDGTPNSSVLTSLGLVTLPITNNQIANNAGIPESKLTLDYRTQDLFNYIRDLSRDVNLSLGWVSVSGVKLEPHLLGVIYRHDLAQIDVSDNSTQFLNNVFRALRDNSSAYALVGDINNELLMHQWADGSPFGIVKDIITNNGSVYPSNYAHTASGIFINTSRFKVIPQTDNDLQSFVDYIDQSSILLLGTRIQNLYSNGVSVNSQSSSLVNDGYGQPLVPVTPAIAYLRGEGNNSTPIDDINIGDDIIQFMPSAQAQANNSFDEQFALVRVGDIVTVNYAGDGYNVEVQFLISETKYIQGSSKTYIVRIAGKNIAYSPNATARIDRALFNSNKYGALSCASGVPVNANSSSLTGVTPSLIVGAPRGAQCLGVGFSPSEFNETHYMLYLALYPDGNPLDGYVILPGIDVTGNAGTTPGSYTLESIVEATNNAFRAPGFNYRFIAFGYEGEFGIMLADSYNNASFSVISAAQDSSGNYNKTATQLNFPNNVIDLFPPNGVSVGPDPLGLGPYKANIASPPFQNSYLSSVASQNATKIFVPLRRNNYYVNGTERDRLTLDVGQALDTYGDGYWVATIDGYNPVSGPPGYLNVSYLIPLNLSSSGLKAGKTLVVQPIDGYSAGVNYGRFVISSVTFTCCPPVQTVITVYDGVHAAGGTPVPIAPVGTQVAIYFNSDSVSFNSETATDFGVVSSQFKRYFEVYIDQNGNTFSHERGRFNPSGQTIVNNVTLYNTLPIANLVNLVGISPKLRGYQFGSIAKITLSVTNFNAATGVLSGYLSSYDGTTFSKLGPTVSGKIGEVIRFYDETNIDYIDTLFNFSAVATSFSSQEYVDIQLFPSLGLDGNIMQISSCQVDGGTNSIKYITDRREFGNTSEEQFTTSATNFITAPDRLLHFNGVVRGFDIVSTVNEYISISGGLALVNGSLTYINDQVVTIPKMTEVVSGVSYPINYALCVSDGGELLAQPITDYDPIAGTPNIGDRVMTVNNKVTGNSYTIDSNLFSYILNGRKDLSVLYIVTSTVSGTGNSATVSLSSRDVRRFINDSDSSIPAVLTSDKSQGNFKTLASALNWLKFNSSFQNSLQVKGTFTLTSDPGLNFPLDIIGAGSTASLTFSNSMNMSNVTFEGVTVTFQTSLIATNVTFRNCTVVFNSSSTLNNVTIENSTVTVNATLTVSGISMLDNAVTVNVAQGFSLGDNNDFSDCRFTYSINPVGDGVYATSDMVNAGSGMMYSYVNGNLTGLIIRDCTFTNTVADHYPFISIQLTAYSAIVEDISISNNSFNSQVLTNDLRAVISFTSTITSPAPNLLYPKFPKLVNVFVESNICNYDQMIIISTVRTAGQPITGAMLIAVNCKISHNACGTIGFITAGGEISHSDNSISANGGFVRNKSDQLIIEKNSCKLITNLDSKGSYIAFSVTALPSGVSSTDWVQVGTGACCIFDNAVNWILTGCSSHGAIFSDGISIMNNRVSPNDSTYLNNFIDSLQSTTAPPNVGILLRVESSTAGSTHSIISENIITQKPVSNSDGTTSTFYYTAAAIACFNNAQVVNNTVSGVINNSAVPVIFLQGTGTINVRGNNLNRQGQTIQGYISGLSSATNTVSITGNIFDSPYIDAANTIELSGYNIPGVWSFYGNVNQTNYVAISPTDFKHYVAPNSSQPNPATTNPNTNNGANPAGNIYISAGDGFSVSRFLPYSDIILSTASTGPDAQYLQVSDYDATITPSERNFSFTVPLDYALPVGVKIISAEMGVWLSEKNATLNTSSTTNNQFTLSLITFNPTHTSNNSTHGITDVRNNLQFNFLGDSDNSINNNGLLQSSLFVGSGGVTESNLSTATQYLTILPTQISPLQNLYVTGNGTRIAATFDLNYLRGSTASGSLTWNLSPIVIKYRW